MFLHDTTSCNPLTFKSLLQKSVAVRGEMRVLKFKEIGRPSSLLKAEMSILPQLTAKEQDHSCARKFKALKLSCMKWLKHIATPGHRLASTEWVRWQGNLMETYIYVYIYTCICIYT